jgi:hypothetical protein
MKGPVLAGEVKMCTVLRKKDDLPSTSGIFKARRPISRKT